MNYYSNELITNNIIITNLTINIYYELLLLI